MAEEKDQAAPMEPEVPAIDDVENADTEVDEEAKPKSSTRPVKRNRSVAPVKKDRPTPKQAKGSTHAGAQAEDPYRAKNPAHYVRQSVNELKKVTWPTLNDTKSYFVLVLMFVVFIMVFVSVLDTFFGWGLLKILG